MGGQVIPFKRRRRLGKRQMVATSHIHRCPICRGESAAWNVRCERYVRGYVCSVVCRGCLGAE